MPLVAAAVCPHPPLVVPEVASGAAAELDELRAACDAALSHLFARDPAVVVLVGSGPTTRQYRLPYRASFARWGAAVEATLGPPSTAAPGPAHSAAAPGTTALPLSLTVGVWLARRAVDAERAQRPDAWDAHTVAADATPAACAALGERLRSTDPWALLVLGDGSACRGVKAPGYDDPRAEPFDKTVAEALATADAPGLLALDPTLAAELRAVGRAPWQVLGGAVLDGVGSSTPDGGRWRGDLLYERAPYGVAYFVATWTPPDSAPIMDLSP